MKPPHPQTSVNGRGLSDSVIHVSVVDSRCRKIACICLLVHAFLLLWICGAKSPFGDESAHLVSGLSHWRFGNFDLYRVNPPLGRLIAAAPLLIMDPKVEWPETTGRYDRFEFTAGARFLELNGRNAVWLVTVCRLTQIPISMLGAWICFLWARKLYGPESGLFSLVLWCFCPNILTWASAITPDICATVFGVAACYAFWTWLRTPRWSLAVLAGLALGAAELSRSTWIILFAMWPLIWMFTALRTCSWNSRASSAVQLIALLFVAVYVLNVGYGFERTLLPLRDFSFTSKAMGGPEAHLTPGNRFRGCIVDFVPVPLPENYLLGIDSQKREFEIRKWSYLAGEWRRGGWYHYYIYAFAVKMPLGTLALICGALYITAVNQRPPGGLWNEVLLLLPAAALICLVSCQTGFNWHFRYVLPAIPYAYVFASKVQSSSPLRVSTARVASYICIVSMICESLAIWPNSMSFFNGIAGGAKNGAAHLLHSNSDWGQDLLELKRFTDLHPEVKPIRLAYYGSTNPDVVGLSFEPIAMRASVSDMSELTPGWYAISASYLQGYRFADGRQSSLTRFKRFTPHSLCGYSIYVYKLTAADVARENDATLQQRGH